MKHASVYTKKGEGSDALIQSIFMAKMVPAIESVIKFTVSGNDFQKGKRLIEKRRVDLILVYSGDTSQYPSSAKPHFCYTL